MRHLRRDLSQIVILVRHGAALDAGQDARRPLSATGRARAERMASWLAGHAPELDVIAHSGKARAKQTAEIFAHHLGVPAEELVTRGDISPSDDPEPVATELQASREDVMLVGHLPFLARLASRLLTGEPDRLRLHYPDAGVAVLGRTGAGFALVALLSPEELSARRTGQRTVAP